MDRGRSRDRDRGRARDDYDDGARRRSPSPGRRARSRDVRSPGKSARRSPSRDRKRDEKRRKSKERRRSRSRSPEKRRSRSRSRSRSPERKKRRRSTSSERAQRKAEKRKLKEELKKQKETQMVAQMAINLGLGYTDKDNPFNDTNLNQKFVWAKKVEGEQKKGLNEQQRLEMERKRREEAMAELEKLNRKRAEREEELKLREEEAERLRREQERAKLGDWETKELEFHLEQAKRRAQIRIKEGRAKPVDVLAMNLSLATDGAIADDFDAMGLEMEMEEPYSIFQQGLQLEDVDELDKDIRMYLELEKDEDNIEFWKAMLVVCDDELEKRRQLASRGGRKGGVAPAVLADIEKLLRDKNYEQLIILQKQVEAKLAAGGPVDVEYWEALMRALLVWKAKARLKDMHRMMLKRRLERLKEKQKEEAAAGAAAAIEARQPIRLALQSALRKGPEADMAPTEEGEEEALGEPDAYDPSMSPKLLPQIPPEDAEIDVLDEEEDIVALAARRRQVIEQQQALVRTKPKPAPQPKFESNDDRLWREEASKEMDLDEEVFAAEVAPETRTYTWQDKYRPRKPRYFNRVHTGYEWNKYNQTHYDTDNPPPKVVQGYKFNIFYPDLIDKTKAPTFQIIKDKSNPDIAVIKFTAGPPYEDIAFNIVNKEWEHSHKKGFRCVFDRGVLQLHFRFKRHFYRK